MSETSAPPRHSVVDARAPRWQAALPVVVFAVLSAGAVAFWRAEVAEDRRAGELERVRVEAGVARRAEARLAEYGARAERYAAAFARGGVHDASGFAKLVGAGPDGPRAMLAAGWFTHDGDCEYAWAREPDPLLSVGSKPGHWQSAAASAGWAAAMVRGRVERTPQVVAVVRGGVGGGRAHVLISAAAVSGEGTAAAYLGSVTIRVDVAAAVDELAAGGADGTGYDVELSDGGGVLARRGTGVIDSGAAAGGGGTAVRVLDRMWQVRARPGAAMAEGAGAAPGRATRWALAAGLVVAAGLAWVVFYALHQRWRAAAAARRQVAALSTLSQTAGAISSAPGTAREALDRLAGSARELLGVQLAIVAVVNETFDRIEVVARVGQATRPRHAGYSLDILPVTRAALVSGRMAVVNDVPSDPPANKEALRDLGVRSGMWVPLAIEGRVIGLLFLGHPHARAFGEAEQQVADALAAQAAVILANSRLAEQKDAALAAERDLARRHESLFQIATEIYGSANLDASLQRLAEAAPALLDVDVCMLGLRTGPDATRVVAVTGNYAKTIGETHRPSESNAGRAWAMRRPLVIDDGPNDASLHPAYRHRMHVGSVAYLPLLVGDADAEPIGTMTLIRHVPRAFGAETLELARVLTGRAAAAIQTARLHECAREAAQTQAMLLRELNHRVKNNLSSIVALLAMDRPEMTARSLAWLTRVSDRITTMARTHELFVGGNDRVELRELLTKLLPALSLIKPGGAEIRTELDADGVELGTERAVSLAMVLNELCWNALEHGTRERGVLWIRARGLGGGRLAIEVEDEGAGGADDGRTLPASSSAAADGGVAAARPSTGRGTGRRLVEGLVARELRGSLTIARTAAGGTLARVEIPVEDGELEGISFMTGTR